MRPKGPHHPRRHNSRTEGSREIPGIEIQQKNDLELEYKLHTRKRPRTIRQTVPFPRREQQAVNQEQSIVIQSSNTVTHIVNSSTDPRQEYFSLPKPHIKDHCDAPYYVGNMTIQIHLQVDPLEDFITKLTNNHFDKAGSSQSHVIKDNPQRSIEEALRGNHLIRHINTNDQPSKPLGK